MSVTFFVELSRKRAHSYSIAPDGVFAHAVITHPVPDAALFFSIFLENPIYFLVGFQETDSKEPRQSRGKHFQPVLDIISMTKPMDKDTYSPSNLFSGIEKEKQSDILSRGQKHLIAPGAILFREGTPALQCHFVQRGRLKLSKLHAEGKETIVRYINPGEITAAVAVFREKKYPVTAAAVGPTEVVCWDRKTVLKILSDHPSLTINLLYGAIERLDEMQSRYLEVCAERVEQRIAHALLRIMRKSGRKIDAGVLIDFGLSRQDLADYTGTTPYTVSRTLSNWERRGWVASGREKIVVTDPHALATFSEAG